MGRVVVIVAVLVGLLCGSAEAETPSLSISEPLHLPMIESLEPVAQAYWAARGVELPEPVEVFAAANSPEDGGFAEEPGHRIWLTQQVLEYRGPSGRENQCMIYLHERGHNAGLSHDSGYNIMSANPWEHWGIGAQLIPKCFHWAEWGFLAALGR